MTKQEEIMEGVEKIFDEYDSEGDLISQILLYLHSRRGRIEVDRDVPHHKLFISPAFGETLEQEWYIRGYQQAQQDMLNAGYVAVEPIIKEETNG